MGTPTTGTTGLGSPQDDLQNHTKILRQLKETTEVSQRQRGDQNNSFVKLGELLDTLAFKYTSGQLSFNGSPSGSVSVVDSITGTGVPASPLKLSGDAASPGNSMYYGTNASGAKGYFSFPSGPSLTVTDGVNSVAGVTTLNLSEWDAVVSGSTPNASISSGNPAAPAQIPDMVYWFKADAVCAKVTSGFQVPVLPNFLPWWNGDYFVRAAASSSVPAAKYTGTTLNSLRVLTFAGTEEYTVPAAASAAHQPQGGFVLSTCTAFFVVNPTAVRSSANGYSLFTGGSAAALELRLTPAGAVSMTDGTTTATGTAGVIANATWVQLNATYTAGAQAFRVARAAAGTGTVTLTINIGSNALLFYNTSASFNLNFVGSVAEIIIYDRVLTGTEISSVEAYLLAKWGV